jgi:photosystem II stability/assembly factor-like uncharacterized protein
VIAATLLLAACSGPATATPVPATSPTPAARGATQTRTTGGGPPTATPAPTGTAGATTRPNPPRTATAAGAVTPPRAGTASPFILGGGGGGFERAGLEGQDLSALAVGRGGGNQAIYAGGLGVAKSTDGGRTWSQVRGPREAPRVSAIAVAPSNAQTVYVGVGEGCARGGTHPGFVSTDGGATWRETGTNINALAVAPGNARLVYAVSCRGVERSADAGGEWEVLRGAQAEGFDPALIAIAPGDAQTLYVALASEGGTVRVRRSTDGGTTWQEASPPGDPIGPLALAVDATEARMVYLSTLQGPYRSTDGGRSWELLSNGLQDTVAPPDAPPGFRNNSALVADPGRRGALWLGTGGGNARGTGVYRTRNGGAEWEKVAGDDLGGRPVRALVLGGTVEDPILYAATDDGLWSIARP